MPRHICDKCEEAFVTVRALRIHRRLHTGEQPSKCTCHLCGWDCGSSDHLAQHMLIHTRHKQWKKREREREQKREQVKEVNRMQTVFKMWEPFSNNTPGQIQQENVFGVPTTTYTQHTEHPNGTATTVSTVNSPLGTAIVRTAQRPTSPITMRMVSQASGTFTSLGPEQHNNDCALCLKPLSAEETMTTLCNHTFHKNCLLELSEKSNSRTQNGFPCPSCWSVITYEWLNS